MGGRSKALARSLPNTSRCEVTQEPILCREQHGEVVQSLAEVAPRNQETILTSFKRALLEVISSQPVVVKDRLFLLTYYSHLQLQE